jgi:hypothetical protein
MTILSIISDFTAIAPNLTLLMKDSLASRTSAEGSIEGKNK